VTASVLAVVFLINHSGAWYPTYYEISRDNAIERAIAVETFKELEKAETVLGIFSKPMPPKGKGDAYSEVFKIPRGSSFFIASPNGVRVKSAKTGRTAVIPPAPRIFAYTRRCRFPDADDPEFVGWPISDLGDVRKEDLYLQVQSLTNQYEELRGCVKALL